MSLIIIVVRFVVVSVLVARNCGSRAHVLVFCVWCSAGGNEGLRICPEQPSLVLESQAPTSF